MNFLQELHKEMIIFFITEMTNACNYAVETSLYVYDSDLESLIQRLDHDSTLAVE